LAVGMSVKKMPRLGITLAIAIVYFSARDGGRWEQVWDLVTVPGALFGAVATIAFFIMSRDWSELTPYVDGFGVGGLSGLVGGLLYVLPLLCFRNLRFPRAPWLAAAAALGLWTFLLYAVGFTNFSREDQLFSLVGAASGILVGALIGSLAYRPSVKHKASDPKSRADSLVPPAL